MSATTIEPIPPIHDRPHRPSHSATTPARNSPSWFEVPMNTELTEATRPRISSGVRIATNDDRMTTLITSGHAEDDQRAEREREGVREANAIVANPRRSPRQNMISPALRRMRNRPRNTDVASAPIAGAERNRPNPQGPHHQDVARVDRQERGRSTEEHRNRSSVIAPSTTGWRRMKSNPANSDLRVGGSRSVPRRSSRIIPTSTPAVTKSTKAPP